MIIIVKKFGSDSRKAPAFKPHYNRELGKYYHSKTDYYGDLKKKGLIPFTEATPVERKPYKASKWAHDMVNTVKQGSRKGKFVPGDRFIKELKKKGVDITKKPKELPHNAKEGGFHD